MVIKKSKSVRELVYEELKKLIIEGEIQPEERIVETEYRTQVGSDEVALMVLGIFKVFLPILLGGFAVLGILGGIGLLGYKPWARILVIVLSALSCLNVPIGTAKGVYSLWALLQDDTMDLFQGGSEPKVTSEEIVNSSSPE